MADLYIQRFNASFIKVLADDEGVQKDLYEFFRYQDPTFVKNKWSKWDGTVRMYNKSTGKLPYGLLEILFKFIKDRQLVVEMDPRFKEDIVKVTESELAEWADTLDIHSGGKPIAPYDYQLNALFLAVRYSRMTLLAATSAGKSLIAYMLVRYYEMLGNEDGLKTLIVVPSINLVSQMAGDFKDYSSANGWDVSRNLHPISEGAQKDANKPVYISTWQSIKDQDKDYFSQFGRIIVDEAHGASAECVKTICENAVNAYQRIGMTGTLNNNELHPLMVQGNFGPIQRVVTTKQLQDAGRATKTLVTMMQLDYPTEDRQVVNKLDYQNEIEWLMAHQYRNKVIKALAKSLKGNTLMLFNRVEDHQKVIFDDLMAEESVGKTYLVINGDVKNSERDIIKAATERGDDIVILATYGTMSTGVSIKKLHNLVICHPSKSIIRILQSLGRMIRLHVSKDLANIYHLVDDLTYSGRQNFALKHGLDAYKIYKDEQHQLVVKKVPMGVQTTTRLA